MLHQVMEVLLLAYSIFSSFSFSKTEPDITFCNNDYVTEDVIIKKVLIGQFYIRYGYSDASNDKIKKEPFGDFCVTNNFDANKEIFSQEYISKAPTDNTSVIIVTVSGTIGIHDQAFITLNVNYSEFYHSRMGVQKSDMSYPSVPFVITDYGPTFDKIEWFISCHFISPNMTSIAINLLVKENTTNFIKICPDKLDPSIFNALSNRKLTINMFDDYKPPEECDNGRVCSQKKSGVKTFARMSMLTFALVGITICTHYLN